MKYKEGMFAVEIKENSLKNKGWIYTIEVEEAVIEIGYENTEIEAKIKVLNFFVRAEKDLAIFSEVVFKELE